MEILQMLVLEPKLVILDEVDSGLDIDALKSVANGVNWLRRKNPETAFIIITHHARILHYIKPDFVHVMLDGKIVKSGGIEVGQHLEEHGYKEFGIEEKA
jgi:Fe-S cluster assembly ATP-binding protein